MESIINHLVMAFTYIVKIVDWVYIFTLMLTCYTLIKGLKLNKIEKKWLRTRYIVIAAGVIFAGIFDFFQWKYGLPWVPTDIRIPYAAVLVFSFVFAQFLNLYGVEFIVEQVIKAVLSLKNTVRDKILRS